MHTRYVLSFFVYLFGMCGLYAQQKLAYKVPAAVPGLGRAQMERIAAHVWKYPEGTELSVALLRNDSVFFYGIQRKKKGFRAVENRSHAFETGSVSKVFTSVLLSYYVAEGSLSLQTDINTIGSVRTSGARPVSLQQLASHTAGLPRLPANLSAAPGFSSEDPYRNYNSRLLLEALASEPFNGSGDTLRLNYSNYGAGLLGFVLTQHSGLSYEDMLQRIILQPLGMKNTTSQRKRLQVPMVYSYYPDGKPVPGWDFDALAGAGAVISTTEDLALFAAACFDTASSLFGLPQRETYRQSAKVAIGLGWFLLKNDAGDLRIWHNGATAGYTSSLCIEPQNRLGVVILSNLRSYHEQSPDIDRLAMELLDTGNKP